MRLIHIPSLTLKEFDEEIPPYTILSHTWRKTPEVTFAEFERFASNLLHIQDAKQYESLYKNHYPHLDKILGAWSVTRHLGLEYLWVDTCCIDKSNSAELNESINSMFSWYEHAKICLVYLDDCKSSGKRDLDTAAFRNCRWFKRAWTLQELLASQTVYFFDKDWAYIGNKLDLAPILSDITRIEADFLDKRVSIQTASVAKRMSWAAGHEATREEDKAYSLLGIFGVNIPIIYGERSKSFIRLQEEILKEIDDHSIFAWKGDVKKRHKAGITKCGVRNCESPACDLSVCTNPGCQNGTCTQSGIGRDGSTYDQWFAGRQIRGLFATSPDDFASSGNITSFPQTKAKEGHITITNRGIYMPSMRSSVSEHGKDIPVLVLNCFDGSSDPVAIYLHHEASDQYTRAWPDRTTYCPSEERGEIYMLKTLSTFRPAAENYMENSIILKSTSESICVLDKPSGLINRQQKTFFPTMSRVPSQMSLLVMVPNNGLVRIWFGTKLQQGKDHEILPWCRAIPESWPSREPPLMGLPTAAPSPSLMSMLMKMAHSGAPRHFLPWPLEECSDEYKLALKSDQSLDITIKKGRKDGHNVFNLEIRLVDRRVPKPPES